MKNIRKYIMVKSQLNTTKLKKNPLLQITKFLNKNKILKSIAFLRDLEELDLKKYKMLKPIFILLRKQLCCPICGSSFQIKYIQEDSSIYCEICEQSIGYIYIDILSEFINETGNPLKQVFQLVYYNEIVKAIYLIIDLIDSNIPQINIYIPALTLMRDKLRCPICGQSSQLVYDPSNSFIYCDYCFHKIGLFNEEQTRDILPIAQKIQEYKNKVKKKGF